MRSWAYRTVLARGIVKIGEISLFEKVDVTKCILISRNYCEKLFRDPEWPVIKDSSGTAFISEHCPQAFTHEQYFSYNRFDNSWRFFREQFRLSDDLSFDYQTILRHR